MAWHGVTVASIECSSTFAYSEIFWHCSSIIAYLGNRTGAVAVAVGVGVGVVVLGERVYR